MTEHLDLKAELPDSKRCVLSPQPHCYHRQFQHRPQGGAASSIMSCPFRPWGEMGLTVRDLLRAGVSRWCLPSPRVLLEQATPLSAYCLRLLTHFSGKWTAKETMVSEVKNTYYLALYRRAC